MTQTNQIDQLDDRINYDVLYGCVGDPDDSWYNLSVLYKNNSLSYAKVVENFVQDVISDVIKYNHLPPLDQTVRVAIKRSGGSSKWVVFRVTFEPPVIPRIKTVEVES